MNLQEELVLKILESVDVIQGKTKFVKILHFTCKLLEKHNLKSPFDFIPDQFGVNTQQLEPVLLKLQTNEMVKVNESSSSSSSKRHDLYLISRDYLFENQEIQRNSSKIEFLVQELNQYSTNDVIAISYHLFPETTTNSRIKPKINNKITEMFSPLSIDFEESVEQKDDVELPNSGVRELYPQFNDLDMRMHMAKSLGLTKLPAIRPDIIDELSELISKKHPFFKTYDLGKMLEDDRRG